MMNHRRKQSPQRGGFTLVELLAVLLILVTVLGLGIAAVQGRLALAKRRAATAYVKILDQAIEGYANDVGYPPTTEQGLAALLVCPDIPNPGDWGGPYIRDTATSRDPWGNDYQYISPGRDGRSFDVWSYGPDGMDGTEDDIGSWPGGAN